MSYLAKVQRSIDYIEANLREELSLVQVAKEVAFSPYHFHYVFGVTVGETFRDYIRKRRLTKNHTDPIEEFGYCYATPEMVQKDQMRYVAGIKVKNLKDIPKGMIGVEVPAQNYAVFTHRGPVEKIAATYDYIYGSWFPKSGMEPADGPDLEKYDERFKYGEDDSELDIYVPVVSSGN